MGTLFTLDADTKAIIQQGLDDLITELGKDCQLVFPGVQGTCPTCNGATVAQGAGTNFFRTGNPLPTSTNGVCPMCNGSQQIYQESTSPIRMLLTWKPKINRKVGEAVDIRLADADLFTKFYLTDVPDVIRADRLIVQLPLEPYIHQAFKLISQPGDPSNIIQGRYCVAYWRRSA